MPDNIFSLERKLSQGCRRKENQNVEVWDKSRHLFCFHIVQATIPRLTMTPFLWASTVTNGSAKAERQLSG